MPNILLSFNDRTKKIVICLQSGAEEDKAKFSVFSPLIKKFPFSVYRIVLNERNLPILQKENEPSFKCIEDFKKQIANDKHEIYQLCEIDQTQAHVFLSYIQDSPILEYEVKRSGTSIVVNELECARVVLDRH